MSRRLRNITLHIKDAEIVRAQLPSGDLGGIGAELDSTCGGTYIRCDSTYAGDFTLEGTTTTNPVVTGS